MPRGYRCIVLAAFGWLVLAASPPDNRAQGKDQRAAQSAQQSLSDIAAALKSANEPKAPDPGCEQGRDNRNSDLCAQWKAADAAEESATWTRRTFWLTLGGLVIGGATLGAAVFAALYARDAAREGARSANAADNTHKAYVASERAVLRITDAFVRDHPERVYPAFSIEAKNIGRGNAKIFDVSWQVEGGPMWDGKPRFSQYSDEVIKADDKVWLSPFSGNELPESPFFFAGRVRYSTLVDSMFEAYFCFKFEWVPDDGYISGRYHVRDHPCAGLPTNT
ncbi:MAG: hypothetical protein EON93_01175 [Burkholderiales bacterium]|nr:MAG: hypothetical protein EON93_01175 [Burkholderiales bacterium]